MRRIPFTYPIGSRFGRWTTIGNETKDGTFYAVSCTCDCGTIKLVRKQALLDGTSVSCGCHRNEVARQTHTKHGMSQSDSRSYNAWQAMRQRCNNINATKAYNYSGRGITICDRWDSFTDFLIDMGEAPSDKHSIERINNDQGYFPENCKWATVKEQNNNKRTNINIEFKGKTQTLKQWAEELEVTYDSLRWRYRCGWRGDQLFEVNK
jgi:hypothetical protein